MKAVYVKVLIMVEDSANAEEVIAECDYNFDHELIGDTEIIDFEEQDDED